MVCFKIQNVNWNRVQHTPAHLQSDRQAVCKLQTASSCSEGKTKPGHSLLPYREGNEAERGKMQKPLYFILFHIEDTLFSLQRWQK